MTTLRLYQTHLTLDRNAKVDNIEIYLSSLPARGFKIQYQQISLDMTINLNLTQTEVGDAHYNYARLEQDDKVYYFFILGAEWRAKKTVALSLSMDTVNTFWDELVWSSKTSIVREHQDRYKKYKVDRHTYLRNIDYYNEGLNPVLTLKDMDTKFFSTSPAVQDTNWYLIYKTRSDITPEDTKNPISMMLVNDKPLLLQREQNNPEKTIPYGRIQKHTLFITSTGNVSPSFKVVYSSGIEKAYDFGAVVDGATLRAYRIVPHGGLFKLYGLYYTGDAYPYAFAREKDLGFIDSAQPGDPYYQFDISLKNIAVVQIVDGSVDFYKTLTTLDTIDGLPNEVYNAGYIPEKRTVAFNDLDRSNSKFVKIIQLPYPPATVEERNGLFTINGDWTYDWGYQTLINTLNNQELGSELIDVPLSRIFTAALVSPTGNEEFNYANESKLFNSEFYQLTLNYGDAALPIKPERFDADTSEGFNPSIGVDFFVSNALSSTMMFKTKYKSLIFNPEYYKDGILFSTVSTEKPIFNSSYVDYLRSGYNYDKEALNEQNRMARIQAIVSGIGGAVGIGGAATAIGSRFAQKTKTKEAARLATQDFINLGGQYGETRYGRAGVSSWNIPNEYYKPGFGGMDLNTQRTWLGQLESVQQDASHFGNAYIGQKSQSNPLAISFATQLISGGISAIGSAINTAMQIESNNRSFASGMTAKQNQSVNALGISDIDIQTQAVGNELKLISFAPEYRIQEQIAKVLHYTGYSHPVQEIPNFTSRYWFNFVQCDPTFKDEAVSIYSNYLDDIKARFNMGITVYHSHNGVYDWEQEKENWEQWLIMEA